jgi:dihydrofolate reductase
VGKIVVTEFVSLDGVMQAPGGGEEFAHAGWTFAIDTGEEGRGFKFEEAMDSAALLLGRVTYEGFAAAWPTMEGPFADQFNGMPKYVVSATLTDASWNNSTVLRGNLVDEVTALRDSIDGEITVHGSGTLVRALLEHGLVDELRLMVFPVVLGSGARLFGPAAGKQSFRLTGSKIVGDGVAIMIYQPAVPDRA